MTTGRRMSSTKSARSRARWPPSYLCGLKIGILDDHLSLTMLILLSLSPPSSRPAVVEEDGGGIRADSMLVAQAAVDCTVHLQRCRLSLWETSFYMAWYTVITTAITFDCPAPPSPPKDTLSDNTSPITNCDTLVNGKVL